MQTLFPQVKILVHISKMGFRLSSHIISSYTLIIILTFCSTDIISTWYMNKKLCRKTISEHFSTDFTDADILPTRLILCRVYSHAEIIPTKTMFTQNFSPHYLYRTPKYLCRHYSHKSKFYSKIIKSGLRLSSHTISS